MDWLKAEILTGFQRLAALGLDYTPDGKLLAHGTVNVWVDALLVGNDFDEQRDTPRIREAFRRLSMTCTSWPKPAQFLTEFHRATPEQPRIGHDRQIPATREGRIRKLSELLGPDFRPDAISDRTDTHAP